MSKLTVSDSDVMVNLSRDVFPENSNTISSLSEFLRETEIAAAVGL